MMKVQDRSGRMPPHASRTVIIASPTHPSVGDSTLQESQKDSPWGTPSISSSFSPHLMNIYSNHEIQSNGSASSLALPPSSAFRKVSSSLARFPRAIKKGRADKMVAKEEKRAAEEAEQAIADVCYQAREKRRRAVQERTDKDKWFEKGFPQPMLDRSIDLEAISDVLFKPAKYLQRDVSAERYTNISPQNLQLFTLPSNVRKHIYDFCFPEEHRPISLSPEYATKAAFNSHYFATVCSILENVEGGLKSFSFLRADLLNYFWSEYHFHVTINCFSASPFFHPLQHIWLHEHIGSVKNITIELDYTTLAASSMKAAPHYTHNRAREEAQLSRIIEGLAKRVNGSSIDNLTILCRRYMGNQPHTDADFQRRFGPKAVLYCPNYVVQRFAAVTACLHGKVCHSRVVGFDLSYTKALLRAIMGRRKIQHIIPNTPAWPPVPHTSALSGLVIVSTMTLKSSHKQEFTPKLMAKEFISKITPKLLSRSRFDTPTLPSLTPTPGSAQFQTSLPPRPVTPPLIISPPEYLPEFRQLLATPPMLSVSSASRRHRTSPTSPIPSIYLTPRNPATRSSLLSLPLSPTSLSHYQPTLRRSSRLTRDSPSENENGSASKREGSDFDGSSNYAITNNLTPAVQENEKQRLKHDWKQLTHVEHDQNFQKLVATFPHVDRYIPIKPRIQIMPRFSHTDRDTVRSKTRDFKRSMAMSYRVYGGETANFKGTASKKTQTMNFKHASGETTNSKFADFKRPKARIFKRASREPATHNVTELKLLGRDATRTVAVKLKGSSSVISTPARVKTAKFKAVELKFTSKETTIFKATKLKCAGKDITMVRGLGLKCIDRKTERSKTAEHKHASGDAPKSNAAEHKHASADTPKTKAAGPKTAEHKHARRDAPKRKIKTAKLKRIHEGNGGPNIAEHKRAGGDAPKTKAAGLNLASGDTSKLKATVQIEGLSLSSPQMPAQATDVMTLEQINAINEKDPAFARGVRVIRSLGSLDQDPKLEYDRPEPSSQSRGIGLGLELPFSISSTISTSPTIPSEPFPRSTSVQGPRSSSLAYKEPVRCTTSMGPANTDSGGLKMKYMSFFNKFRG